MTTKDDELQIYVACLASYNSGTLFGEWVDLEGLDADDIGEAIKAILAKSPEPGAEEYAVHDYSGFPEALVSHFGEWPDLKELVVAEDLVDTHGSDMVNAAVDNFSTIEEAQTALDENCLGEWESLGDWGAEHLEGQGALEGLSQDLRGHFDFDSYARDEETNGSIWSVELGHNRVAVFQNN